MQSVISSTDIDQVSYDFSNQYFLSSNSAYFLFVFLCTVSTFLSLALLVYITSKSTKQEPFCLIINYSFLSDNSLCTKIVKGDHKVFNSTLFLIYCFFFKFSVWKRSRQIIAAVVPNSTTKKKYRFQNLRCAGAVFEYSFGERYFISVST